MGVLAMRLQSNISQVPLVELVGTVGDGRAGVLGEGVSGAGNWVAGGMGRGELQNRIAQIFSKLVVLFVTLL